MGRIFHTVYTHSQADAILGSHTQRRIKGNTWLVRKGDDIALRFHSTDIITIHRDGTYTLDCAWNRSTTTKSRLCEFSPARVYQKARVWYIGDGIEYYDGIRVDRAGKPIPRTEEEALEFAAAQGDVAAQAALADYRAGLR